MKLEYYRDQKSNIEMAGARATFVYRECMKNHAAAVGAHAVDGCGEFMPGGAEGTIEAFRCAACNCHRNFHRKVMTDASSDAELAQYHYHLPRPVTTVYRPTVGLGSTSISGGLSREEEQEGVSNSAPKKRIRTKFTQEQKDKMTEFAEKLGWKIQKHDDGDIEEFCKDVSVKRHVLKVWIHNNKYKLDKTLQMK